MAGIRLFDSGVYLRRAVAGARLTGAALAAKFFAQARSGWFSQTKPKPKQMGQLRLIMA
jgi:hypothetical protein